MVDSLVLDFSKAVLEHAKSDLVREVCGVGIVERGRLVYVPCRNIASLNNEFHIHPKDYADASDRGQIVKIVHSHIRTPPNLSEADTTVMEKYKIPWIIGNPLTEEICEYTPSSCNSDLFGREYVLGVSDCLSIIHDYYSKLGIQLPQQNRFEEPWNSYEQVLGKYEAFGFARVDDLKEHDVILMNMGSTIPFHFAVYLGNGEILHHAIGRLSSRDAYNGSTVWYKRTVAKFRHLDLL